MYKFIRILWLALVVITGIGCTKGTYENNGYEGYFWDDEDYPVSPDGAGGASALSLPFPHDEVWQLTRGYNNSSHIDYGYDWLDDSLALDFADSGCDSWRKPITPIREGTVLEAGYSSFGYGNYVVVDHGFGYRSRYGHFDELMVEVGEDVTTDDVIGLAGNSGNVWGTVCAAHPGTHLHVAYYLDGDAALPEPMSGHSDFTPSCWYGDGGWVDCNGDGSPDNPMDIDCRDEDGDGYGDGEDCLGDDCNDTDAEVHSDEECAQACDRTVPTDVSTIQAAIDLATSGEVVCVEAGTYVEDLVFNGEDITVKGLAGAENTHLYGVATGIYDAAVKFEGGGTRATVFQGFTVHGAGGRVIRIEGSSPTLQNLVIEGSGSDYALSNGDSGAMVQNVRIENSARYGITAYTGSSGLEFENVIVSGSDSAGLRAGEDSDLTLTNTVFYGNGDVGVWAFDATIRLKNSIIMSHTLYGVILEDENYALTSTYNTYWGNGADYGLEANAGSGDHTEDPLFVNAMAGDFTLEPTSPCIDDGSSWVVYNDADGTQNDRGAYGGPLSESW